MRKPDRERHHELDALLPRCVPMRGPYGFVARDCCIKSDCIRARVRGVDRALRRPPASVKITLGSRALNGRSWLDEASPVLCSEVELG